MNYLPESRGGKINPVVIRVDQETRDLLDSELRRVFKKLDPETEIPEIDIDTVNAEWQEAETGERLSNTVILCLHGGGYITGSAAMERTATLKLAQGGEARVFAVDYRLAPQHPFPAALLDAIVAYKYLVDPPQDASHKAVDSRQLIIGGDSAGVYLIPFIVLMKGGLCIALMTFLAHSETLPLPAGLLAISPLLDLTGSFPSTNIDSGLDWLPCLRKTPFIPKPSEIWPPSKPRFDFYTDLPLNPLVSP